MELCGLTWKTCCYETSGHVFIETEISFITNRMSVGSVLPSCTTWM